MQGLSLTFIEIGLLMCCGIMIGIVIMYIIISNRQLTLRKKQALSPKAEEAERWKLKYFNDIEFRDKEIEGLRNNIEEIQENNEIDKIEAEEQRKINKSLKQDLQLAQNFQQSGDGTAVVQDLQKKYDKLKEEFELVKHTPAVLNTKVADELERLRQQNTDLQKDIVNMRSNIQEQEETPVQYKADMEKLRVQNRDLQNELLRLRDRLQNQQGTSSPNNEEIEILHQLNDELQKEITDLQSKMQGQSTAIASDEDLQMLRTKVKQLETQLQELSSQPAAAGNSNINSDDYLDQLRKAQVGLQEHNQKVNELLGQIDIAKATEEKQKEIIGANERLNKTVEELKTTLQAKEETLIEVEKKANLTTEMTTMLGSAYNEFDVLQDKMQKLEHQLTQAKRLNMEYEEFKENNSRMESDFKELKDKYETTAKENQEMQVVCEKLKEEQRDITLNNQQLKKKVIYLEELNVDLQSVADTNKKLEGQIKRIGELENMLNTISGDKKTESNSPKTNV